LGAEVGSVTTIITVYLDAGRDFDSMIDWAVDHCKSFVSYKVLELGYEEKAAMDCWFKLEIEFGREQDILLFELRWA
jgi:hypothetical protein